MATYTGDIEKLAEHIFRAQSDSSTRTYLIDITPGKDPHCECMAFAMNRNRKQLYSCKHVERAQSFSKTDKATVAAAKIADDRAASEEFDRIRAIEVMKKRMRELQG